MNVGSTSVVPRTCLAGRFLGWMLTGLPQNGKRRSKWGKPGLRPAPVPCIAPKSTCSGTYNEMRSICLPRKAVHFRPGDSMANKRAGMANPTRLKPIKKEDGVIQVIIETPKGSPNKFAFDPKQRIFALTLIKQAHKAA